MSLFQDDEENSIQLPSFLQKKSSASGSHPTSTTLMKDSTTSNPKGRRRRSDAGDNSNVGSVFNLWKWWNPLSNLQTGQPMEISSQDSKQKMGWNSFTEDSTTPTETLVDNESNIKKQINPRQRSSNTTAFSDNSNGFEPLQPKIQKTTVLASGTNDTDGKPTRSGINSLFPSLTKTNRYPSDSWFGRGTRGRNTAGHCCTTHCQGNPSPISGWIRKRSQWPSGIHSSGNNNSFFLFFF